ncbi:MAG: hypothetical protein FWG31_04555 [Oscillospiraceae bacterium]|nr:hypothetical protein [Oscillospiraceae bacterium]
MGPFLSSFFSMLVLKFMGVWNKVRLIFNPTWWRTTGVAAFTKFFRGILNVKPRDKNDYYPLLRWLVSKRLTFAILIGLTVVSVWYIAAMSPLAKTADGQDGQNIPTYRWKALPLKFYKGEVRIVAKDGHIAYHGSVKGGKADGQGRLFDGNDALIYAGAFENSMYEGAGELFYPDGLHQYIGSFSQNIFHGEGAYYRPSGVLYHKGGYAFGLKSGPGELYNAGGNKIYTGSWHMDHLVYAELVGKTTAEAAEMYEGRSTTYSVGNETCAALREINALYAADSGENTVEQEWKVRSVYVLSPSFFRNGKEISDVTALRSSMDGPEYAGFTWVTLADAVALNLAEDPNIEPIPIQGRFVLEDVFQGTSYDRNREIYIYVYHADGLIYTFFCESATAANFIMYSIEQG